MATSPIINLAGIRLSLPSIAGEVHILRGVDLAIAEGETVGIVGPSGSGKSSLLSVMCGLEQASAGSVIIDGADFGKMGEDALACFRRERVGIVLQAFHLIPTMTALENVAVPLELAGRRDAFARAEAELDLVGLGHRLDHYPAQLSGGEQQRVALARALAPDPKLLFADEPTGNLDSKTGETIISLMFDLHRRRQTTLILITHDTALARRCERILHIDDGQISHEERGDSQKIEAAQ